MRFPPAVLLPLLIAACAGPPAKPPSGAGGADSYVHDGRRYFVLPTARGYRERGIASWYGEPFHGRRTSSGERYDMHQLTAAHRTLPLPSYVRVTNLENGRSVVVRVNDRGPFVKNRLIDLSYAAARALDMVDKGTALVEVEALDGAERHPEARDWRDQSHLAGRLFIQVGAFTQRTNAERLVSALRAAGFEPVRLLADAAARWYRVRLGPLADLEAVEAATLRLQALGHDDVHILVE